jgi:hypothetical protein
MDGDLAIHGMGDDRVVEQVIAVLKAGPLTHLPSGSFAANSAWLVLTATATANAFQPLPRRRHPGRHLHAKATTVAPDVSPPPAAPAVRSLTRPRRSVDGASARPWHDVFLRPNGSM